MMKMIQSYDVKKGMAVAGVLLALGCFGHGAFCPCFSCQEARDEGRRAGLAEGGNTITIQPRPRPRYDSITGIDIAIRNVRAKGRAVTIATVWDELRRMEAANDISLPGEFTECNYSSRRGGRVRTKRVVTDPKAKREFSVAVAQMVARVSGGNVQDTMEEALGPNPRNYHYEPGRAYHEPLRGAAEPSKQRRLRNGGIPRKTPKTPSVIRFGTRPDRLHRAGSARASQVETVYTIAQRGARRKTPIADGIEDML